MAKRCFRGGATSVGKAFLAIAGIVLCAGTRTVSATDEFLVDVWRFDDDLPRDGIISMGQGNDGYLWVSSRYGLARFDGARFVNFSEAAGATFLGHHYAQITAEPNGTLWLGTPGGGLVKWRSQHLETLVKAGNPVFGPLMAGFTNAAGKALAVSPDGRVLTWSNQVVEALATVHRWGDPIPWSVCQDTQAALWMVTYEHKLVRVRGTNAQELVYGEGDARRNWIALQPGANGEIWAGTQLGMGAWRGDIFEPLLPPQDAFPVDDVIVMHGPGRNQGSLKPGSGAEPARRWVISSGQAWLLQDKRWVTNILFEPSAGLYETSPRLMDRDGNLWFTTTKASLVRVGCDGTLLTLSSRDGLPPGRVASLYQDREGSIWVGIEHAGLARLRKRSFFPLGARENIEAPLVWSIAEDAAGAIWEGTENDGLHRWQDEKFTRFSMGPGIPGSIYSLCLDHEGRIWAGTKDGSVSRFENGKFEPTWEVPEPGWNKGIYVIHEDRESRIWFGTGLGLFCWEKGNARRYDGRGFSAGIVRAMCEDSSGRLWAGISQGSPVRLARVDGDGLTAMGQEAGLEAHDVFGLHADTNGTLWIGTVGDGLWRWQDGEWFHYTTQQGLPDDRIYSIADDGNGHLWLGSPAGIFRVTRRSITELDTREGARLNCLSFDRSDGLPTRECSGGAQPSIQHSRDGRLLFAMAEGAVALSPDKLQINDVPPPILVEEIRVDGKEFVSNNDSVMRLEPGRHVLEIHYTATSLAAPTKIRFRCRMVGVETEWHDAGSDRSATYSLASPGDYRFQVIACNNDGVWSETGATLGLQLPPYYWQRSWFKGGVSAASLLGVAGAVWVLERGRARRKHEELERQQLVEKERARIARDIHDELGASLTEIGLLSEFAQREAAPPGQVRDDIRRIAAKAQSSTRALDEIVWAVNPRNDTLDSFISYACAHAEEHLRLAGLRCRLDAPSPLPRHELRADIRHHLFLAFKEALNNIVKHARASEVHIGARVLPECLTLSVSDNGCGFIYNGNGADPAGGNGLANMKARLASAGGSFECESKPGGGTTVRLMVPL